MMDHRNLYRSICHQLNEGKSVRMATVIAEGKLKNRFLIDDNESKLHLNIDEHSDIIYTETIRPLSRLLILGGGHVARCLADFAARCDFKVWVADDREEYASPSRYKTAEKILNESFVESIAKAHLTSQDYVIVMTRGHRFDRECLRAILNGNIPAWIGMMASNYRAELMRQMLLEEGYDSQIVESIRMPVGIKIGSVTPEEIAVSILAELIHVRHSLASKCEDPSEAEAYLLKLMDSKGVYVEVSVLKTSGSSPRKIGARMLVWPDGHISGSIGGGLAEAVAIEKALKMMGTDDSQVLNIQMTDIPDDIHDEEMPCGGIMEILLCAVKATSV